MTADFHVVINEPAIHLLAKSARVRAGEVRLAMEIEATMKRLAPVSPRGDFHRSGRLRDSIRTEPLPDGSFKIGPTVSYGRFVNEGTRPHIIRSHGRWPLRNRETGQVFGPIVHHPGTRGVHFVEAAAQSINGEDIRI